MNTSPMNYLVSFAIGAGVWMLTGMALADYLSETVSLATMTIEDFLFWYRIAITVVAVIALVCVYFWFYKGSQDQVTRDLAQAKKTWAALFVTLIILAIAALLALVVAFLDEGLIIGDYLLILLALSLHSFIFYWLCTFLMSPLNVKYLVPLKN